MDRDSVTKGILKLKFDRTEPWLTVSLAFVLIVAVSAALAPWLSPYPAGGLQEGRLLEAPGWAHWMGTDGLGRDLFTRILYGARVSMSVGLGSGFIALVIGTAYGLMSGFKGGTPRPLYDARCRRLLRTARYADLYSVVALVRTQYRRIVSGPGAGLLGSASRASRAARSCKLRNFSSSKAPGPLAHRREGSGGAISCRTSWARSSSL